MSKDTILRPLVLLGICLSVCLIIGFIVGKNVSVADKLDVAVDTLYFPQPRMMTVDTCGSYRITPRDTTSLGAMSLDTYWSINSVDTVQIHLEWLWVRDVDMELVRLLELPWVPLGLERDRMDELVTVPWAIGTVAFGNVKVVSKDTSTVGLYRLVRIVEL